MFSEGNTNSLASNKKRTYGSFMICWWSAGDSNSSPRQCECRALPDELAPHNCIIPDIHKRSNLKRFFATFWDYPGKNYNGKRLKKQLKISFRDILESPDKNYNGHGRVAGTEIRERVRLTRCNFLCGAYSNVEKTILSCLISNAY